MTVQITESPHGCKETGENYTHVNTHLDHVLDTTRLSQAKVLLDRVVEFQKNGKVVLTGDFNADLNESAYKEITEIFDDAMSVAENTDSGVTYHAYGKYGEDSLPIDFIFVSKGTDVNRFVIADHSFVPSEPEKLPDGQKVMYPSDHHAVCADIYF